MQNSREPPLSAVVSIEKSREVERGRDKWEPLLADMGTLASPRVHQPTTDKIRSYSPIQQQDDYFPIQQQDDYSLIR